MTAEDRLIRFYAGDGADHRGRPLREIQQWPDDQLETVHDYIQWLFPLPEASGFNLAAPTLTENSILKFRNRPDLQQKLRDSFLRMMNFYGLEASSGEQIVVNPAAIFDSKSRIWLSPGNHNHLRITRILRCLTILGLESEAKAFFECLSEIYKGEQNKPIPAISDETMRYWRAAVGDTPSRMIF